MIHELEKRSGKVEMKLNFRLVLVVITVGWLFAPGDTFAQSLVEGVRKYEVGDYAGAIAEWESLARQGNADAQFNLGQIYRLGRGAPVDLERASGYYESAARQGHIDAQGNLATLYFFSTDDPEKRKEAIELWRSAARAGDSRSQYMLGVLLFNGDFLEKEYVEAYGWIILAVGNGLVEAEKAELKMRRHLSVKQMAEGRVLSRSLVDKKDIPPATEAASIPPMTDLARPDSVKESPVTEEIIVDSTPATTQAVPDTATPGPSGIIGTWRLQLGAFRSEDGAENEWRRIIGRYNDLVGTLDHDVIMADLGAERGIFYRLQAGPFPDKTKAAARCEQMKASGLNCFVLSP